MAGRRPGHPDAGARCARPLSDGGFILPGLVDAHCHIGIAPRRRRRSSQPRRGPRAGRASTATPACSRSGTPARRTRTRNSTTTPTCRDWPAPAGTSRRSAGTCATSASRSTRAGRRRRGRRAGQGRQRLGQAGRRLDRPRGRRPRAGLGRATRWPPRSQAAHAAGARVAAHAFAEESVATLVAGRRRLGRARHRPVADADIDEMARRGTALVPTMINIETFGEHRGRGRGEVPRRTPPTCGALQARLPGRGRGRRTRPACRSTSARRRRRHRARAGGRGDAAAARAGRHVRRWTYCAPARGARGSGSASPVWSRAGWPIWWSTTTTRAPICACCRRHGTSSSAGGSCCEFACPTSSRDADLLDRRVR